MGLSRYIVTAPIAQPGGPVCVLCNKVVDSESLVEGYPGAEDDQGRITEPAGSDTCKVLVKHHGAEELMTFDMGSRLWGPSELAKWMQRHRWFDPLRQDAP